VKADLDKLGEPSRAYSEKINDESNSSIISVGARNRVSLD
jgi:hypothetical protein